MIMKKIAVLGFGKSGQSSYRLLKALGYDVYVFDDRKIEKKNDKFFCEKDSKRFFDFTFDEVVVSPGIAKNHPFITYCVEIGTPIISELELGYRFTKCPVIAVTGTNGKTTTVSLVDKIMKANGKKTIACGNYGYPITDAAKISSELDYLIVETSSYQLEFIDTFKPFVSAVLNIGFDHIKWHGSLENYKNAKLNIFKNQSENDFFIKNAEDNYDYTGKAKLIEFSKKNRSADCFLDVKENKIVVNYKDKIIIENARLFGVGNLENIAASVLISKICGLGDKITMEVVETMENLPHRIEYVGEIDGVKFYNDSKSTNIDSVINALNSFESDKNIVLILGGKHKGESFSKIVDLLEKKTRAVVVYGEDRSLIMTDLEKLIPVPLPAFNVKGAIVGAFEVAAKGDIVLFSPGGASCKPYNNFEERGEDFKKEFEIFKDYYENTPGI